MLLHRALIACALAVLVALPACGPDTSDCRVLKVCDTPSTGGAGGISTHSGGSGGLPADLGQPCSDAGDCSNNLCVDGVCCESACDGTCHTCGATGSEGLCTAQVAGTDPDNECGSGRCDGVDACASGEHLWSKRFGGTGSDSSSTVDIGPNDVIALAGGYFTSQPDFGGGPLPAPDVVSATFAAQLDAGGNHNWSKRIANSTYVGDPAAVAMSASGIVALAGSMDDNVDLGSGPISANSITGIVYEGTVSSSGSQQQANVLLSEGSAANAIDWLANTRVIVGLHRDEITIGSQTHPESLDFGNRSLLLFRADGPSYPWSQSYQGTGITPVAIAVDPNDNLYAAGTFDGNIALTPPLTSSGKRVFVIKLDGDGNVLWSRAYASASTNLEALTVDALGNVYLAGSFTQTTEFGGPTLTSAGTADGFVAALDPLGEHLWSKRFGGAGDQAVTALDASAAHLVLAGTFVGGIDLGGGNLSDESAFVAKLTQAGNHVWSRALSGPVNPHDIAATSDAGCVVAGAFSGSANLGGVVLSASGPSDVFVARFAP